MYRTHQEITQAQHDYEESKRMELLSQLDRTEESSIQLVEALKRLRQAMITFLKNHGFTEEEINEKLSNL